MPTSSGDSHDLESPGSQTKEPLMATFSPGWPFQLICADYFELNNDLHLSIVDRFSSWLNIYHFKPGCSISSTLILTCRTLFIAYDAKEELSLKLSLKKLSSAHFQ